MGLPPSDECREVLGADQVAERCGGVAGEGRIAAGPYRRRSGQAEQWSHLAEMLSGAERGQQELPVRCVADDVDLARLDDVDEVARVTLAEEAVACGQRDLRGRGVRWLAPSRGASR